MSAESIILRPEEINSISFESVVANYAAVGSAIEQPIRIFLVQNLTDANLMFSMDGTVDHFVVASNGFLLLDITANKTSMAGLFFATGEYLYVKRIGTPTEGSVYFTAFYGSPSHLA